MGDWRSASGSVFSFAEFDGPRSRQLRLSKSSRTQPREQSRLHAPLLCWISIAMTLKVVYIQVPFCQTKCTYCNFHTGVVSQDTTLLGPTPKLFAVRSPNKRHRRKIREDTVYFGGGTPSLLDPDALAKNSRHSSPHIPDGFQ